MFVRQYYDEREPEEITEKISRDRLAPDATDEEWERMKQAMKEGAVLRTVAAEYWWG